jgi:hypothetical protein
MVSHQESLREQDLTSKCNPCKLFTDMKQKSSESRGMSDYTSDIEEAKNSKGENLMTHFF